MQKENRPWVVHPSVWPQCQNLFPTWLKERRGVVVYQNQNLDSTQLGATTFMPARYIAQEDNQLHDAPNEHFPDGIGMPSQRQQKADVIRLEDFGDDLEKAMACFKVGEA